MNKPLALILILAAAAPLIGCTTTPMRRDTIFHQTDESPRQPANQKYLYGHRGTRSPNEQDPRAQDRRDRNRPPSDPDGIVKPRDLEPDGGRTAELTPAENPVEAQPKPGVEETKDVSVATTAGEPPYAEAVPGKYGLVYSPFVKDKKEALVNVTDENNVPLPPGTEVTDPHTGKIFRVP